MKTKVLALTLLALAFVPSISFAADTVVNLSFQNTVAAATKDGKLDGSVKFYLAGNQPAGHVTIVNDNVTTKKKPTLSANPARNPAAGRCSRP